MPNVDGSYLILSVIHNKTDRGFIFAARKSSSVNPYTCYVCVVATRLVSTTITHALRRPISRDAEARRRQRRPRVRTAPRDAAMPTTWGRTRPTTPHTTSSTYVRDCPAGTGKILRTNEGMYLRSWHADSLPYMRTYGLTPTAYLVYGESRGLLLTQETKIPYYLSKHIIINI